jgi:hypothetical protein
MKKQEKINTAKIKENDRKIKYLEKTFANSYFELFADLIERGYSIQQAIDLCYDMLTENE